MLMENSTLYDVRTRFLNRVLFGAKTTPELLIDSCTSDEFINLLNMDNGIEKDTFFIENFAFKTMRAIIIQDVYNRI